MWLGVFEVVLGDLGWFEVFPWTGFRVHGYL